MIFSLAKKFFPLCPCVVLLISCGKKVQNSSSSELQHQDVKLPDAISLEATATGNYLQEDANFTIPRDGDFEIPKTIAVSAGSSGNYKVRLDVNVQSGEEEFHCTWKGTGSDYQFEKCEDADGRDLGLTSNNVSNFSFPIDQGKAMKLHLEAAPSGSTTKAKASLTTSWK